MVSQIASRLGLRRVPNVLMTPCALPPLVWSIGLRPRVILPSQLFDRLSSTAQSTILAHELAPRQPPRLPSSTPRTRGDYALLVASRRVVGMLPIARP